MPYDEKLAARVQAILADDGDVREQKMFGGLTFLVAGHMCCGIVGETLMLRMNEDLANQALEKRHVRPMDFTGRPMSGMVYTEPSGLDDDALNRWLNRRSAHRDPPQPASGCVVTNASEEGRA